MNLLQWRRPSDDGWQLHLATAGDLIVICFLELPAQGTLLPARWTWQLTRLGQPIANRYASTLDPAICAAEGAWVLALAGIVGNADVL